MTNSRVGKRLFHGGFTLLFQICCSFNLETTPDRSRSMTGKDRFRMTLTPEQKDQIRQVTGKEADTIELSIEELEERIAPMTRRGYRERYLV
jgi:hypothetical protein